MMTLDIYRAHLWNLLEPVRPLLEAPDVAEVMINGPHEVFVERGGRLELESVRFEDEEALLSALRLVSQVAGRPLSPERPILEARLPDGSRLEAVIPPASPTPHVAIRRFPRHRLTLEHLVASGSLDTAAATLLAALVASRRNVVISGGTGTGKTSLLNVLSSFIGADERVVTIEDARELQPGGHHLVPLEAQPGDATGRGRVTIRDLLRATLRLRPDRILVGEVRDGAALDMVHAMISGHAGCLSTVHASHPMDALHRIETLALMADVGLPLPALRGQVASAIQVLVQVTRLGDGQRVVQGVYEVRGLDDAGGYRVVPLCARAPATLPDRVEELRLHEGPADLPGWQLHGRRVIDERVAAEGRQRAHA